MIPSTSPRRYIASAFTTDPGLERENNEDRAIVDDDYGIYILADGVGGNLAGEIASQIAVDSLRSRLGILDIPSPQNIREALLATQDEIRKAAAADLSLHGMSTTVVAADFTEDGQQVWLAHVGDSRAYLYRAGKLRLLTTDHTVYNQLVSAGLHPPADQEKSARKGLSQALGGGQFIFPEVKVVSVSVKDRLLLCSDGLTDVVMDTEIAHMIARDAPLQAICNQLVTTANRRGGPDNITVILSEVRLKKS